MVIYCIVEKQEFQTLLHYNLDGTKFDIFESESDLRRYCREQNITVIGTYTDTFTDTEKIECRRLFLKRNNLVPIS